MRGLHVIRWVVIRWGLSRRTREVVDAYLIVSEPRSGSTWLMEQLVSTWNGPIAFEPFHPEFGHAGMPEWGGIRPFVPLQAGERVKERVDRALTMKSPGVWEVRRFRLRHYFGSAGVLVKSVRAVFLLPFLVREYRFKRKPLVLLRHPIATAKSNVRAWDSRCRWEVLGADHPLNAIRNEWGIHPQNAFQDRLFLAFAATWFVTTREDIQRGCDVVHYEDLLMRGKQALEGTDAEELVTSWSNRPSSTVFERGELKSGEQQLTKALGHISEEDRRFVDDLWSKYPDCVYRKNEPFPVLT